MRAAVGDDGNEFNEPTGEVHLATIALRRVSSTELQEKNRENPMNRLVPYLDLFARLSDEELARLASVPTSAATNLRRQVIQVDRALERFADLLPRLSDAEMVRLTGATAKTVRFWRLCQPRAASDKDKDGPWSVARAAEKLGQVETSMELTTVDDEAPLESGIPLSRPRAGSEPARASSPGGARRHDSSDLLSPPGHGTLHDTSAAGRLRHPSSESQAAAMPTRPDPTEITWSGYRMPAEERDAGRSKRAPVDLSSPRPSATPPPPPGPDFARSAAAVASARKGNHVTPAPEVLEKHRAAAQQMGFSGAPFPGYDAEASGTHEDGIFIGLELPES